MSVNATLANDNFLLFYEGDGSSESESSPKVIATTSNKKNSPEWKKKQTNKESHPSKQNKRKEQKKHGIEISESISESFDLLSEEGKENQVVGSFLISNTRTSNSDTTKSPSKRLKSFKDLWIEKESVPLQNSMDSVTSENSSLVPLPEENELTFVKSKKKAGRTTEVTQKPRETILVDSLTISEEISSLEPFPGVIRIKESEKMDNKAKSIRLSSSPEANSSLSSEIELSEVSSENQAFNTLQEQSNSDTSESDLFVDTQKTFHTQNKHKKPTRHASIVIESSSEGIQLDDFSESSEQVQIIPPTRAVSPTRSPSRSPSSSPKKPTNREPVLKELAKRISPPSSPKEKKTKQKSQAISEKRRITGRKRKRQEKTQSMYEGGNEHPAKRQRRATYSQRSQPNRLEDASSGNEDSSIDTTGSLSSSPVCSLKLSTELQRIMKRKKQKKIFKGFSVLLTGVDGLRVHESVHKVFPGCKELGELIRRLILAHGGQVSSSFVPSEHYRRPHKENPVLSRSVLVSSEPKRTEKYLLGIVYGAPALSFQWVVDCCEEQILLDFEDESLRRKYQLPSGISAVDGSPRYLWEVLGHPKEFEYPPCIFDATRCEVVGVSTFRNHWTKILRAAGAKVVKRLGSEWESKGRGLELVIAEEPVSEWVITKCKKLEIPLCTSDFIVESILMRDIAPFDSFSVATDT